MDEHNYTAQKANNDTCDCKPYKRIIFKEPEVWGLIYISMLMLLCFHPWSTVWKAFEPLQRAPHGQRCCANEWEQKWVLIAPATFNLSPLESELVLRRAMQLISTSLKRKEYGPSQSRLKPRVTSHLRHVRLVFQRVCVCAKRTLACLWAFVPECVIVLQEPVAWSQLTCVMYG